MKDKSYHYDLIIIGAGAAGMAAAVAASEKGLKRILLVDRNKNLGGILQQCIHDGFGLHILKRSLTGPEYANYWREKIISQNINLSLGTTIISIDYDKKPFVLSYLNEKDGYSTYLADSLILATGCIEKTLGQMRIPGSRPAGVYTAGTVQYMMNICNFLPGKTAVILGSGDIGLIMARRLTLEGVEVKLILGQKASGLARNYVQCVQDFDIPIIFGYTLLSTHGFERLKGVSIAPIDRDGNCNVEEKKYIPCDTLLIATGLLPESDLWRQSNKNVSKIGGIPVDSNSMTCVPGVFACGNVTEIYDLVDKASLAGKIAGISACNYLGESGNVTAENYQTVFNKEEPKYEAINSLHKNEIICIMCPKSCVIQMGRTISGYGCERGRETAIAEMTMPKRVLTTTMKVIGGKETLISVRSEKPVDKTILCKAVMECNKFACQAPVDCGQVVVRNVAGSGVNMIASGMVESQ